MLKSLFKQRSATLIKQTLSLKEKKKKNTKRKDKTLKEKKKK